LLKDDVCTYLISPFYSVLSLLLKNVYFSYIKMNSFSRSEERRVGKSVDLGGRRIIKKKKRKSTLEP